MAGLDEKVHLLFGDVPHLIHEHTKIHDIIAADKSYDGDGTLHEHEIHLHDLMNTGPLYLDDNIFAGGQCCAVCLSDARGAEGGTVNGAKNTIPLPMILLFHNGKNHGKREGICTCLKLH